jgi:hypothetical protein
VPHHQHNWFSWFVGFPLPQASGNSTDQVVLISLGKFGNGTTASWGWLIGGSAILPRRAAAIQVHR